MSADPGPVVERLRAAGCVFAEDEAALLIEAASDRSELDALVERRAGGLPLEHLLGWAEFGGLRISVAPGVFVPRRRTEALAHEAVAALAASASSPGSPGPAGPPVVVDLCCGTGAIGAAVAAMLLRSGAGPVDLHAAEIDPVAVACARHNLAPFGGRVHAGDLDAPLPAELRGRVSVLVANVPYVPTDAIATMPPEARDHEPRIALDGGADGLDVARRVAAVAPGWLAPGGSLLIETGEEQASVLAGVFTGNGLHARVVEDYDLGSTVVIGTRP
ncbi:putative protein N(5)-glutamine methyltransferase [Pseudonocardia sp. KRD291]|uniref:putative protein N(5)-glutamine methyltransferase n=1 Tax=Pseudonocardia sp. KRD291 TaxID=2792007 RepID=UPI001C4A0F6D|nr:putative protein N(5)-glutamine methyltransferase [Pseudonocardia sp. KRD291]MBW0106089.1 putative protein N(5)-glutamine methyltransferase [Pseudonocardia sp. KRD291]